MIRPILISILRAAAVLVAIGFLVAYVLFASGRLSLQPVKERFVAGADAAPALLASSKTLSHPLVGARTGSDGTSGLLSAPVELTMNMPRPTHGIPQDDQAVMRLITNKISAPKPAESSWVMSSSKSGSIANPVSAVVVGAMGIPVGAGRDVAMPSTKAMAIGSDVGRFIRVTFSGQAESMFKITSSDTAHDPASRSLRGVGPTLLDRPIGIATQSPVSWLPPVGPTFGLEGFKPAIFENAQDLPDLPPNRRPPPSILLDRWELKTPR